MKIYTEINYKWLAGRLVETDSKSFEYEGNLTLCGPGGGGGGGDPLTKAITKVADTTTAVVTDPVGTTTGALDTAITTAGEAFEPAAEGLGNVFTQTGNIVTEGLATGTESIGMNEGFATTLTDFGSNLHEGMTTGMDALVHDDLEDWVNEGVDKIHDFGKDINDIVSDELTRWQDFVTEKGKELSKNFPGMNPDSPRTIKLDKLSSFKANKLKKIKADLGSNTAKSRARSSLRIA